MRQIGSSLAIQRASVDAQGRAIRPWLKTGKVLGKGRRALLTITGDHGKATVYVNGAQYRISPAFGLVSRDLTGHLVLGSSTIRDSWPGQIEGLAIYDFALTAQQVAEHYESWKHGQPPNFSGEEAPISLYAFDEQRGTTVHDQASARRDLTITARYFVLHTPFLEPIWGPFRSRWDGWMQWGYWSDVLLNIAGFVPLGFFFTSYILFVKPLPRVRLLVLGLGLVISLSIEAIQYFLPTRDSSMTDVLTNTLGTIVGIVLCRSSLMPKQLTRRTHEQRTAGV